MLIMGVVYVCVYVYNGWEISTLIRSRNREERRRSRSNGGKYQQGR